MNRDWMILLERQTGLEEVLETNRAAERYGLALTRVLREQKRVEFGEGIVPRIIDEFCDSDFIDRDNYADTVVRLQEIFYLYKNEMQDEVSDEELLHFMREQFEEICFGDLDYLEGTCLNIFAQAVRAGYRGYRASEGRGEYGKFDEVKRWDPELYLEALRELCWR